VWETSCSHYRANAKSSLCIITQALRHEDMGELRYSSAILDFGTRRRWVVSFTPPVALPRGKSPPNILDRRLDGPESRSGHRVGENLTSAGNRTWVVQPIFRYRTDRAIKVGSFSYGAYKGKFGTEERRSCFADEDLCLGKVHCLDRNIFLCPFVGITGYQELLTESSAYIVCFS
jgi:hypothetical protein